MGRSGLVRPDSVALVRAGDAWGLRFWLTGLRASRAAGVAGWSAADRRFNGYADMVLANLLNAGRRLSGSWQSVMGRTAIELTYTEPWVAGSPISLTGYAQQLSQDTTQSSTRLSVTAEMRATVTLAINASIGFDRCGDSIAAATDAVWAGSGFVVDTRDARVFATNGALVDLRTHVGTRRRGVDTSAFASRTEFDCAFLRPVGDRFMVQLELGGRAAYSPLAFSPAEGYMLGGRRSVRGFAEGEFRSNQLVWMRTTCVASAGSVLRAYPFVDCAAFRDEPSWRTVLGYGVGFNARTQAGAVGVDYGVPAGQNPFRGKIHISFTAEF